jgi:hypothetical protein
MIKDKDIRFKFIKQNKELFKSGIFINEYGINGKNVVDFALFKDDYFIGFEIKSEADNLKRLMGQLKSYLKLFDYIYLIVHEKHKEETLEFLKNYKLNRVGIYLVDNNICFTKHTEASASIPLLRTRGYINNLKKEEIKIKKAYQRVAAAKAEGAARKVETETKANEPHKPKVELEEVEEKLNEILGE